MKVVGVDLYFSFAMDCNKRFLSFYLLTDRGDLITMCVCACVRAYVCVYMYVWCVKV